VNFLITLVNFESGCPWLKNLLQQRKDMTIVAKTIPGGKRDDR